MSSVRGLSRITIYMLASLLAVGSASAAFVILGVGSSPEGSRIPNGVYVWDYSTTSFKPLSLGSAPYTPSGVGYYLLYFHNNLCPHCQDFYPKWINYLRAHSSDLGKRNLTIVEIVCNWFTSDCEDSSARITFSLYNVQASPAILLLKVGPSGRLEGSWDIMSEYRDLISRGVFPRELGSQLSPSPEYVFALVLAKIGGG